MIELRHWREDDLAAVRASQGGTPQDAAAWVRRQQERSTAVGVSCAVAEPGHPAAGYVGLIRRPRIEFGVIRAVTDEELVYRAHQRVVGIGYWIAAEHQGQGLATRATRLLCGWALRHAGVVRVEALIEPDNIASRRVAEKSGFVVEGQLRSALELDEGRYSDALVYSLLASDL